MIEHVKLWACYADSHTEIDIAGDRDGLRALAAAAASGQAHELSLDNPPESWLAHGHALDSIRIEPNATGDPRICFARDSSALVLSGDGNEIARIVGGAMTSLADGPSSESTVASHVHLDPTSDPERRYYAPASISVVAGFADTDE